MDIAASADRRTLFVGGMPVWSSAREGGIPSGIHIPVFQPAVGGASAAFPLPVPAAGGGINQTKPAAAGIPAKTGKSEGGKHMANTTDELRAEYPGLTAQIEKDAAAAATAIAAAAAETDKMAAVAAATAAEMNRIREIDEMAALFDADTVRDAKFGDKPCTAQEMTYRAAQAAAKKGGQFMKDMAADNGASGAQDVGAAPGSVDSAGGQENIEAAAKAAAESYKKMMGGQKDE